MTATAYRITRCARPNLRVAPTPAETLRRDISELARQIDTRLGNPPGTAERGIYFWFWPRVDDLGVLVALHADAVNFLAGVVAEGADR